MATIGASIVIIARPALFRDIHLDPTAPGNISYLLWMIIGYLLVTAVLVVTLGRLGDLFGRVRMFNLGFVVFTLASIALSLDPLTGPAGAALADRRADRPGVRPRDADGSSTTTHPRAPAHRRRGQPPLPKSLSCPARRAQLAAPLRSGSARQRARTRGRQMRNRDQLHAPPAA